MLSNVPDDWDFYYFRCEACGYRYHASEGGCTCVEDRKEELWHKVVDRLRHSSIDEVEYESDKYSHEDELGEYIGPKESYVRVYITTPDEKYPGDELIFTLDNWCEIKEVVGYFEEDER